jgi:hypothetical protein
MYNKTMKKLKSIFKEFLTPDLPEPRFMLMASQRVLGESESEWNHRQNIETMMEADLKLQWEAQRRTLVLVQRTAIIATLSVIIAALALIFAILK